MTREITLRVLPYKNLNHLVCGRPDGLSFIINNLLVKKPKFRNWSLIYYLPLLRPKLSKKASTKPEALKPLPIAFAKKNNVPIEPPNSGPNARLIISIFVFDTVTR